PAPAEISIEFRLGSLRRMCSKEVESRHTLATMGVHQTCIQS
ncbi:hypothetical protein BMAJHU_I0024, partial [Burkholderia mallei JHU]